MLPNCVEAQLANGSAGDMYGFQGFKIDGEESRRFDNPNFAGGLRGLKKVKGNENKPGEWNKYEITAKNFHAFSRKCPKTSFLGIFLDLTAVNMQKSPYSLNKSCR